jgi:gamma-glutamyltranspeptidase/glutathione hydrolase
VPETRDEILPKTLTMKLKFRAAAQIAFAILTTTTSSAQLSQSEPERATGLAGKSSTTATKFMAAAADPRATGAAIEILREGGSAVDAAIAAQLVLGLVEPQSSGLGGGAFLVHWDAARQVTKTYDARETAPAAAKPERFIRNGKPMSFAEAVGSGLSVGVPGLVRGLELAHSAHGRLPWRRLFEPAIALAEGGFAVSRRLSLLLAWQGAEDFAPEARRYFFDDAGIVRQPGYRLKNEEYARSLREIAAGGAKAFYEGAIADKIVDAVAAAPIPGDVSRADLAGYAAKERPPLCVVYRTRNVCGMGPPSSGAFTVAQTLKLIEPIEAVQSRAASLSPAALHAIAEAEKLAYADRNRYLADPEFQPMPDGLLDDIYLASRRSLIDLSSAMAPPMSGVPFTVLRRSYGADATVESAGTTHMSIIDEAGNAVAMTSTIENAFGSRLWAAGFLLNNQLTDFSFSAADKEGRPIANRVEPGKRPRSSMAPTIVLGSDGGVEIVTGSPGGSRIIMYVVKSLVAMIDWGLDPVAAVSLPNFGSDGRGFQIEPSGSTAWPALALRGLGHEINAGPMTSGVHTVLRRGGKLYGAADPRREGAAFGD